MSPFPKLGPCVPKMSGMGACYCGRRGMPREWIDQMYADYLRLGSAEKVGLLHGRSRQAIFDIFKRRGLKLKPKKFLPAVWYEGVKYTEQKVCGRHRYLRDTTRKGKTGYLHHRVWEKHHGPIPPGFKVCFKDGNHRNVAISNLELLSNSDQVSKHSTGHNQNTRSAGARVTLLLNKFSNQTAFTVRLK